MSAGSHNRGRSENRLAEPPTDKGAIFFLLLRRISQVEIFLFFPGALDSETCSLCNVTNHHSESLLHTRLLSDY